MFKHECLGRLRYESTTTAITMAGVLVSFALEYLASRLLLKKQRHPLDAPKSSTSSDETQAAKMADDEAVMPGTSTVPPKFGQAALSLLILESGIVFHSICKSSKRSQPGKGEKRKRHGYRSSISNES